MNSFRAVLILIVLMFATCLSGNKVDSLSIVIEKTTEESTLLRLYNELTVYQIDLSFDEASTTVEKAIELAHKIKDESGLAIATYNKGRNLAIHRHYDQAKPTIQKAINLLSREDSLSEKLVSAYIVLGWTHQNQTNYYDAIRYFKMANESAIEIQYQSGIASSYINLGMTYDLLGDAKMALDFYEKGGEIYGKQNNREGLLYYYNNIGYIFFEQDDFQNALKNYTEAKEIAIELEIIRMESHVAQNIILTLIELDKIEEALELYDYVYKIDSKRGDEISLAYLATIKTQIELKENKNHFDVESLITAYEIGLETKDLELQKSSAELLAKIYTIQGDFRNALTQTTLSSQIKDSISRDEVTLKIKNLESKKELELKEKDALLIEYNLKKSLERQTLIKQMLILPLVALSFLLFFLNRAYKISVDSRKKLGLYNEALQKTELKLEKQNQDLKKYIEHNIELEQFAHIASHDFKSPLRTISGFSGLLKRDLYASANEKQKEHFDLVEKGISRLDNLINDLLKFSVENSQDLFLEKIQPSEIFSEVIETLDHDLEKANAKINLKHDDEDDDDWFIGDKIKIKQVIQNLISNAIKFKSSTRQLVINLSCRQDEEYLYFTIDDNGIGIDPQYRKKIFNKFTQLNSKDSYEGTGLGLSLCKKYVHKHMGKIWLAQKETDGARFKFSIAKNLVTLDTI